MKNPAPDERAQCAFDAAGPNGNLPAGFLSTFVAKDLTTKGLWTLEVQDPSRNGDMVTLNSWSINYDRRSYQSTDVGQSANSFVSTVSVRAEPGITGGKGGDLSVTTQAMKLENGALISAGTTGSGRAGAVMLDAGSFFADGAVVESRSSLPGQGDAGSVSISSAQDLSLMGGSEALVSAQRSAGGMLTLQAGNSIAIDGSSVSATAQNAGGSVYLVSPLVIGLTNHSSIRTQSAAADGGNIHIDPLILSLDPTSRVSANGGVNGGSISIAATTGLQGLRAGGVAGQRNVTAAGATGVSGSINAGPTNSDIARSLAQLPVSLSGAGLTLTPQCGQVVNVSTFLIQGRGSVSEEPGSWQQDITLDISPP